MSETFRRSGRAVQRGLVLVALVLVVMVGVSAAQSGRGFEEIPGVQEFSGRLIVQPVPVESWIARGTSLEEATARKTLARQIGCKSVQPCEPETAQRHSGYMVGGTSPFGTRNRAVSGLMAALIFVQFTRSV